MENRRLERDVDSAKSIFDDLIAEIEDLESKIELKDLRIGELEDESEEKDDYISGLQEEIEELKQRLNDYEL